MGHSATDLVAVFEGLTDSFGDAEVVDSRGNTVSYVDYDSIEGRYVIETEDGR